MQKTKLSQSWQNLLKKEFKKDYFKKIEKFIFEEKKSWKIIYPKSEDIFSALNYTNFDDLKIVIIWQDPYHEPNQAHWLPFSVPIWIKFPPSLKNIFKEIESDIWKPSQNIKDPDKNWVLVNLSKQWVLLLNSVLTVEKWLAWSHSKIWWQIFTDKIIEKISENKEWVVFILWWAYAKSKKKLIDTKKHFVIEWVHPSPLSSYRWFFWWKFFSKTNDILKKNWKREIIW